MQFDRPNCRHQVSALVWLVAVQPCVRTHLHRPMRRRKASTNGQMTLKASLPSHFHPLPSSRPTRIVLLIYQLTNTVEQKSIVMQSEPRRASGDKNERESMTKLASSSLKVTGSSFRYASLCLWNQLPLSLRQPHSGTSFSISYSPIASPITSSSFD